MKEIPFNLNGSVRVKLTPAGIEHYRKIMRDLGMDRYKPEYVEPYGIDADGWYRTQLWRLMQDFGEGIIMSGPLLMETGIFLEDETPAVASVAPVEGWWK